MKRHMLFLAITASLAVSAAAQMLVKPPNTEVHINRNVASTAAAQLIGADLPLGDALSTRSWKDIRGNELVWREIRNHVDDLGIRHVFYRQYLRSGSNETEVFGSEVGLHFMPSGALWLAAGHQFTSVDVGNRPALAAGDAVRRVLARLRNHNGFRPETLNDAAAHVAWRTANSQLKIVATEKGFRYAWFTFARDSEGVEHQVVMDAESEEILAIGSQTQAANCYPSGNWTTETAVGTPVRASELPGVTRALKANIATDRGSPYTNEAFDPSPTNVTIVQETTLSNFTCAGGTNPAYTIVPLSKTSGTVYYNDANSPWLGSAAGDAMYHTKQTLSAFATLGRAGWNGQNGDANLVLNSTFFGTNQRDNAFFRMTQSDPRVPPTPFVALTPTQNYPSAAAALDVIAHEWGHGVIQTSANVPCVTADTVPCQLSEGFADVIGQIVEKLKQPPGYGLEQSSDWTLHEDNSVKDAYGNLSYVRGALDDAGGHTWRGFNNFTYTFDQAIHRQDGTTNNSHMRGNMMNMALRLLTEGGTNPICNIGRHPEYAGCSVNVSGQGFTKASRILFDTIQSYTPSTAQWENIANYASAAAFARYSRCALEMEADLEQESVDQAFTAIGYPRTNAATACP
jgi:hypothetical protein